MTRQRKILAVLVFIVSALGFILLSDQPAFSKLLQDILSQQEEGSLKMVVGDLDTIWTKDLQRVAIADPSIADAVETKQTEILVSAKKPGKTDVYIWDKYGKRNIAVWVFEESLDLVQSRLVDLLKSANIDGVSFVKSDLEGKVVISGEIDEDEKETYLTLIEPFKDSIVDLVKPKEQNELVEFDVQVTEVSSSFTETLGIEWTNDAGEGDYYFTETLPAGNVKKFADIFKIGKMARASTIQAKINALITEGKARVLSKPKIVAKSGEEASFMVGGQIPVKTTTTSSGGNVTENIIFHDYGVTLKVKPVVTQDGKIDIDLNVDISDIDAANAVGDTVAYTRRSAQTKLYLDNSQTIILAGFIKENKNVSSKKLPLLGSLPLVGLFFRSKTTSPDTQTELFIALTPRIVARNEKKKLVDLQKKAEVEASEKKEQTIVDSLAKTEMENPKPEYHPTIVSGDMAFYVKDVQERIAKNVVYPKAARDSKQQGVVEVALSILRSGALVSASTNKSSGYAILDEAVMETVHRLSPYRAFPSETTLKKITVTIPIVFQLD